MKGTKQTLPPLDSLAAALGERVTNLREERGLSATKLARLADMDVNYLWRIEAGRQNMSLRNVARLAKALEVTLSEIFKGIDVSKAELGPRPYAKRAAVAVSMPKPRKTASSIE